MASVTPDLQLPSQPYSISVADWLSGNALVLINVVGLRRHRRARLVLGWVTVRGYTILVFNQNPPRPTQPGHPSVGRHNEYWGGGLGHH